MRCWWCGVEPDAVHDVTTLGSAEPEYLANWPPGADHEHAEARPTPGELGQAGHVVLSRIQREAWTT